MTSPPRLPDLHHLLGADVPWGALLDGLAAAAGEALGAAAGLVGRLVEGGRRLEWGGWGLPPAARDGLGRADWTASELALVLKSGQPLAAPILMGDALLGPLGFSQFVAEPVTRADSVVGFLALLDPPADLGHDRLRPWAELVGLALGQRQLASENAELRAQLPEFIDQARLYQVQKETVGQLLAANRDLSRSLDVHERLTEMVLQGRGLGAIAETLAELVGNPVLIEDHNFRPIAQAAGGGEPGVLRAPALTEALHQIRRERRPVRLAPRLEAGLNAPRVVAPLVVGREVVGYLSVVERSGPLGESAVRALAHAATVVALELMKRQIAFEVEQRTGGDFLEELLAGRIGDEAALRRRAGYLGFEFSPAFRPFIVAPDDPARQADAPSPLARSGLSVARGLPPPPTELGELVAEVMRAQDLRALVVTKAESVVVLAPCPVRPPTPDPLAVAIRSAVARRLPGLSVSIGLGFVCDSLKQTAAAHQEARLALDISRGLGRNGEIVSLDDLGIYHLLLRSSRPAELRAFARRLLGPLLEYDAEHGSELVLTLDQYLRHNGHPGPTANALHVHVHSLAYRLRRIAEITGRGLDDADHRLNLALALKVHDLLNRPDLTLGNSPLGDG